MSSKKHLVFSVTARLLAQVLGLTEEGKPAVSGLEAFFHTGFPLCTDTTAVQPPTATFCPAPS